MKKNKLIAALIVAAIGMSSCNSNQVKETQEVNNNPQQEVSTTPKEYALSIEDIDKLRFEIESLEIKPVEITTDGLREKTKQKWSKIHFYLQNDSVVKIKTYPYSAISKRTEEFYANKDGLFLVVVEDNGEGNKGKSKTDIDKMYYFSNGKLIQELKKNIESEYSIKESDAEELLSEFNEYLNIYQASKK
jgi:hypothetical protein